jgi:hypothetical protein
MREEEPDSDEGEGERDGADGESSRPLGDCTDSSSEEESTTFSADLYPSLLEDIVYWSVPPFRRK